MRIVQCDLAVMLGATAALVDPSVAAAQYTHGPFARQVTYSFNVDLVPSPDGSRAVIISRVAGREQLFVRDLNSASSKPDWERQITSDDADHEDPSWSPDGRKLAFVLTKNDSRVVYVMNADGTNRVPVTPATVRAIHPSWTPDGKAILYSTDDDLRPPAKNESEIYRVDIETGGVQTLISGGVNTFPVMSPDGRKIAFRRIVGEMNSEVFVADANGANAVNLTRHHAFEGWPAWSPDGKQIAFSGNRNANYQIFVMSADGSNVHLVANTEGRATSPKWNPDGRSIYFTNCMKKDTGVDCQVMVAKSAP